jgi:aspartate/methionine/tyrosine aminotransferase
MLQEQTPAVYQMLSKLGREMYMPKGIITQSAEASEKAHKFNATIGMAVKDKSPMFIDCIYGNLKMFMPSDVFTYAPTTGKMDLRKAWNEKMLKENPSLKGKQFCLPIVTHALTHGLSVVADLFCDDGDYVVTPDKFWGNYRLTFNVRRGGSIATFATFNNENGFNVDGLLATVEECGKLKSKVILILNFPNNPTGYTLTPAEAAKLAQGLKKLADSGINVVAVVDDAYFGMFYGDCMKESLFALLAGSSPNLLAIKMDGATKEAFAWGFRVGFITFAATTDKDESQTLAALEKKVAGNIRGVISNCAHPSQTAILSALRNPAFYEQRKENVEILRARAMKCKQALSGGKYDDQFTPYPFNSGYFLCIKLLKADSEKLRMHLLNNYGVGTISTNSSDLRIAFSCVEVEHIEELFDIVYKGCKDLE